MAAALALAAGGAGRTGPNPAVGCLVVAGGRVLGRGVTADGGRPHAEALALAQAGDAARGATAYVTLEPCAHEGGRGPACAPLLANAGLARVVVAMADPDPRTSGRGIAFLREAGVEVVIGVHEAEARAHHAGFVGRMLAGRPALVLKLAVSLDGRLAFERPDGRPESRWITGAVARAHAHRLRAQADLVVVGRGTFEADAPRLDVRLPGHDGPMPVPAVLGRAVAGLPAGWRAFPSIEALDTHATATGINTILCEGGPTLAAALLAAGRVDRLVLHRAPILLGRGPVLPDVGLTALGAAHGRWTLVDRRPLGEDLLEIFAPSPDLDAALSPAPALP